MTEYSEEYVQSYVRTARQFEAALHADYIVSFYPKWGMFYLSTRFLGHFKPGKAIEITLEANGDIILRESDRKKKDPQFLQSKKVCRSICEKYDICDNAKLIFCYESENNSWKGRLMPQLWHGYGWSNIEERVEERATLDDNISLRRFQKYYGYVIDREEVKVLYSIGAFLAERTYEGEACFFENYKITVIRWLLKDLAKNLKSYVRNQERFLLKQSIILAVKNHLRLWIEWEFNQTY